MSTPYSPYEIHAADRDARFLMICDHATNSIPEIVPGGCLGLPQFDMDRHIAFDIGAAAVTRHMADALNAPAILSNFSRLVIDPNRGEDDPTLVKRLYDGTLIPANRHIDEAGITQRLNTCHRPYHAALAGLTAAHPQATLVSIHSFTRQLNGRAPRPWHVGVLYASDTRLAHPLLARLNQEPDICVGDNEPYTGHLTGDTMDRHALSTDRPHVLIELRNDLIATDAGQKHWATRLAKILQDVTNTSLF